MGFGFWPYFHEARRGDDDSRPVTTGLIGPSARYQPGSSPMVSDPAQDLGSGVNTSITADLRADASGATDRLRLIGQKVGLAPHTRADAFIQLAQPLSVILRAIEFDLVPDAAALYFGPFTADMLTIITQWSIATGQNLKDAALRVPVSDIVTRQALAPAGGKPRVAAFVTT